MCLILTAYIGWVLYMWLCMAINVFLSSSQVFGAHHKLFGPSPSKARGDIYGPPPRPKILGLPENTQFCMKNTHCFIKHTQFFL